MKGETQWYDVTMPNSQWKGTDDDIIQILKYNCKKWGFGHEIGAQNGLLHYQMRFQLNHPAPIQVPMAMFPGAHITPTSKQAMNTWEYITKEGDYVLWSEEKLWKFKKLTLRDWQIKCLERLAIQDDRGILVVQDEIGGAGKTTLAKWMVANHKATYVPPMQDGQDFMAMVMAKPEDNCYIFDIPRSESIKQKKGLWSAVEQVKNGYLYDKRYQWREKWIDPPKIVVFTNDTVPQDALSIDRWDIWKIMGNQLEPCDI